MQRTLRAGYAWRLILLALVFTFAAPLAQTATEPEVVQIIDQALADPALVHGLAGVVVTSLKDGRTIYAKNQDLVFIPASNFKLLVSATSLDRLGPEYRFKTELYTSGEHTPEGILKGDVILVGRGNPILKPDDLQLMANKLEGIKTIEGNIVGDDTWFDDVRLGWGWNWDDEPYYYSAQLSALCLNKNVVDVYVRPGVKEGAAPMVRISPATSYMTVRNDATTGKAGSEKTVSVDRLRGRNVIHVTGSIPLDAKSESPEEAITMEEPTLFAATMLREMLQRAGVEVKGKPVRGAKPEGAVLVAFHQSVPLSEMMLLLNKPSDNLIAETLLKTLGAEFKGRGSSSRGADVEREFLEKAGLDMTALSIIDGSGLARMNYISPHNLATLLSYMYRHKDGALYMKSLPIAGVDGTLRSRMKGTAAAGNCKAKTGYISRVRTLSGYVTTKASEQLVFSIMMNHHLCSSAEVNAVQDKIVTSLAEMK